VEVELLWEDNEQLVTQYEREKQLRKASEQVSTLIPAHKGGDGQQVMQNHRNYTLLLLPDALFPHGVAMNTIPPFHPVPRHSLNIHPSLTTLTHWLFNSIHPSTHLILSLLPTLSPSTSLSYLSVFHHPSFTLWPNHLQIFLLILPNTSPSTPHCSHRSTFIIPI